MRNFNVDKKSFLELVKKRNFKLPPFQREYSWDEENWEEFIQSITNFIDIKKNTAAEDENNEDENNEKWDLDQQEYFAGDIILQKGNKNNDFSEIIDGQQRIVTIFILLFVIYEKIGNTEEVKEVKKNIKSILFLRKIRRGKEEKKIRIDLNNEYDQWEFKKALGFDTLTEKKLKKKGKKRKSSNISRSREFFTKFFETETNYNVHEVYDVIIENFYFALIEIDHNDRVQELFTALNNTGLNLSNSDLLKSLFIKEIKEEGTSDEWVAKIWEKKIVEVITEASKKQTKNREMDGFLIDFWLARYGDGEKINRTKTAKPTKLNVYNLFEYKIIKSGDSAYKILTSLVKYAEVYKYIKDPEYSWWKETHWPIEMFYTVNDISILNYSQLFPVILKLHFEFEKNYSEEKKIIAMKELESTLLFIFRWVTIKEKSPGSIPRFIPLLLEEIGENKKLFNKKLKQDWLDPEFNDNGREKFYNELQFYTTKKNKIWEFVLKRYYWKKYQNKFGFKKEENSTLDFKQQAIYNWDKASVEHLIPQTLPEEYGQNSEKVEEDDVYSLGNVTLVEGRRNSQFSNKVWKLKKEKIKELDYYCPLNWEESFLFKVDGLLTSEDIRKRSEQLINEFKDDKMNLFDVDWE